MTSTPGEMYTGDRRWGEHVVIAVTSWQRGRAGVGGVSLLEVEGLDGFSGGRESIRIGVPGDPRPRERVGRMCLLRR